MLHWGHVQMAHLGRRHLAEINLISAICFYEPCGLPFPIARLDSPSGGTVAPLGRFACASCVRPQPSKSSDGKYRVVFAFIWLLNA